LPPIGDLTGELANVLEGFRAPTVTAGMSWPELLALAGHKHNRLDSSGRMITLEPVEWGSSMTQRLIRSASG
jgi:hypothetical protein